MELHKEQVSVFALMQEIITLFSVAENASAISYTTLLVTMYGN